MQHARTVSSAAHTRIRDPDHVPTPCRRSSRGIGSIPHSGIPASQVVLRSGAPGPNLHQTSRSSSRCEPRIVVVSKTTARPVCFRKRPFSSSGLMTALFGQGCRKEWQCRRRKNGCPMDLMTSACDLGDPISAPSVPPTPSPEIEAQEWLNFFEQGAHHQPSKSSIRYSPEGGRSRSSVCEIRSVELLQVEVKTCTAWQAPRDG